MVAQLNPNANNSTTTKTAKPRRSVAPRKVSKLDKTQLSAIQDAARDQAMSLAENREFDAEGINVPHESAYYIVEWLHDLSGDERLLYVNSLPQARRAFNKAFKGYCTPAMFGMMKRFAAQSRA